MPVKFTLRNQEYEVKAGATLGKAMQTLGFKPEMYLAVREGGLLTEDEILREGDVIKLVAVISGGDGSDV